MEISARHTKCTALKCSDGKKNSDYGLMEEAGGGFYAALFPQKCFVFVWTFHTCGRSAHAKCVETHDVCNKEERRARKKNKKRNWRTALKIENY